MERHSRARGNLVLRMMPKSAAVLFHLNTPPQRLGTATGRDEEILVSIGVMHVSISDVASTQNTRDAAQNAGDAAQNA